MMIRVYKILQGDAAMTDKRDKPAEDVDQAASEYDPRPVSDGELREQVSREEVEGYKRKADQSHANWFSVMNNPYGKD